MKNIPNFILLLMTFYSLLIAGLSILLLNLKDKENAYWKIKYFKLKKLSKLEEKEITELCLKIFEEKKSKGEKCVAENH